MAYLRQSLHPVLLLSIVITSLVLLTLSCDQEAASLEFANIAVRIGGWTPKGFSYTLIDFGKKRVCFCREFRPKEPAKCYSGFDSLDQNNLLQLYNYLLELETIEDSLRTLYRLDVYDSDKSIDIIRGDNIVSFEGFFSDDHPNRAQIDSTHMLVHRISRPLRDKKPDTAVEESGCQGKIHMNIGPIRH